MRKITLLFTAVLTIFSLSGMGQTLVTSYLYSGERKSSLPIFFDSLDNNQKAFDGNSLLIVPSQKTMEYYKIKVHSSKLNSENDVVALSSNKGYSTLSTFCFYLTAKEFSNCKLTVYSTDKVKIALEGKVVKERLSSKDSLNEDAKISTEFKLTPGRHLVSLSFLTSGEGANHLFKTLFEGKGIEVSDSYNPSYGLTLESMLEGKSIYSTSISPSGAYALVKYYEMDSKGSRSYSYSIYSLDNGHKRMFGGDGITGIDFLPKDNVYNTGDALYYIEDKGDKRRFTVIDKSGNSTLITDNLPDGAINFIPSKDKNSQRAIVSQESKIDVSKEDARQYLMPDDRIGGWRNRTNLSLYDFETESLEPLTYGYRSVMLTDIKPSGDKALAMLRYEAITERPFDKVSLFEIELSSKGIDTLVNQDPFISNASYIPNSDFIVVKGSGEAFGGCGNTLKKGVIPNSYNGLLFLLNTKTKAVECITKDFAPSVEDFKVTTKGVIYFSAVNKDSVTIFSYDINSKQIEKVELGLDIVSKFDVDESGRRIVYYGQRYNEFAKSYAYDVSTKKQSLLFFPKSDVKLALGEMREWNFDYKGTKIEGRYYTPKDFDASKKYPVIVYYYAGTTPTDRSFEMRYSAFLYTAQGYVFYVLNPSGTIGYGQEFAARHVNAWGERTADEIIFGVKLFAKEHSFVDSKKIGCMGASYGGFMTQYLQTKTDIFACAISHAGISDITSYWGEGYWGYSYSSGATANSYPWNRKDIYVERSPLFNANKIKTPLLLLHGTDDTNVPTGESIQMFNALKILGKEVEFITIKGENHGIVDYGKRQKWNNTIYAWFAKYLKNDASWWSELYPSKQL